MNYNILLCGVGGQGIITASKIISNALFLSGYDVKKSEIHGLSQRGGSVTSQIRYGEKVYSPIIANGEVNHVISLEPLEVLRYLKFFNNKTSFIINDFKLVPISVSAGNFEYPDNYKKVLQDNGFTDICNINAYEKATGEFNNIKFANSILLGMFSKKIDIDIEKWHKAFENNIKERFIEKNIKAFEMGRKIIEGNE